MLGATRRIAVAMVDQQHGFDRRLHDRRLVDQNTLASILGVSLGRVRELHREGKLPAYQVGSRLRFDVDECLDRLRVTQQETS